MFKYDELIAKRILVNLLLENKVYTLAIFNAENSGENVYDLKCQIPQQILLGVSINGLSILEPKKKTILTSFERDYIEKLQIYPNYLEIEVYDSDNDARTYKYMT